MTEGQSTAHKTPGSFLPSTWAASSQAHRRGLETVGKREDSGQALEETFGQIYILKTNNKKSPSTPQKTLLK